VFVLLWDEVQQDHVWLSCTLGFQDLQKHHNLIYPSQHSFVRCYPVGVYSRVFQSEDLATCPHPMGLKTQVLRTIYEGPLPCSSTASPHSTQANPE